MKKTLVFNKNYVHCGETKKKFMKFAYELRGMVQKCWVCHPMNFTKVIIAQVHSSVHAGEFFIDTLISNHKLPSSSKIEIVQIDFPMQNYK